MVKSKFEFKFEIVSATLNGQFLQSMTLVCLQIKGTAMLGLKFQDLGEMMLLVTELRQVIVLEYCGKKSSVCQFASLRIKNTQTVPRWTASAL